MQLTETERLKLENLELKFQALRNQMDALQGQKNALGAAIAERLGLESMNGHIVDPNTGEVKKAE